MRPLQVSGIGIPAKIAGSDAHGMRDHSQRAREQRDANHRQQQGCANPLFRRHSRFPRSVYFGS